MAGPWSINDYASQAVGPTVGDYASVTNDYSMVSDALFIKLKVND